MSTTAVDGDANNVSLLRMNSSSSLETVSRKTRSLRKEALASLQPSKLVSLHFLAIVDWPSILK
jgi:hypothetical protein